MALRDFDTPAVRRIMRAAKIGLGLPMGVGRRHRNLASDEQLLAKVNACCRELWRRKGLTMDGFCRAHGCIGEDSGDGLCEKCSARWRQGKEVRLASPLPVNSPLRPSRPDDRHAGDWVGNPETIPGDNDARNSRKRRRICWHRATAPPLDGPDDDDHLQPAANEDATGEVTRKKMRS
jgi:hypothetical protein